MLTRPCRSRASPRYLPYISPISPLYARQAVQVPCEPHALGRRLGHHGVPRPGGEREETVAEEGGDWGGLLGRRLGVRARVRLGREGEGEGELRLRLEAEAEGGGRV